MPVGKINRPRSIWLLWLVNIGFLATSSTVAQDKSLRGQVEAPAASSEFVQSVLEPLWRSTKIREPIFFTQGADARKRPSGKLLFKPTDVISMTSATRETSFELGRDFVVDAAAGTITLSEESKIPVTDLEHLYPLMSSKLPKIARKSGDKTRGIFWDEGSAYHRLQVEVTYRHEPNEWIGPFPQYAGKSLSKTVAKFHDKRPITMLLFGDSIALGSNASKFTQAPPYFPAFGELTALALERHFGSKVTFLNQAVDGTTSKDGLRLAKQLGFGAHPPDLVVIAFGMNDVYYRHDAAAYQANIRGMIEAIRSRAPDAEFILVSSMLANAERGIPLDKFPLYRDALAELCGLGVALADVTSLWAQLQNRKTFYDLTGNGVNHPNDFGHCLYAQAITALLIEAPR